MAKAPAVAKAMRKFSSKKSPRKICRTDLSSTSAPHNRYAATNNAVRTPPAAHAQADANNTAPKIIFIRSLFICLLPHMVQPLLKNTCYMAVGQAVKYRLALAAAFDQLALL